jgi:signal transduction histidine kinase/CheY-like chemotaxis protein
LNLFDPLTGHFTVFTKKDGLASDIIYAIKEDNEGRFWISTNSGLSVYDPAAGTFKNYTTEDGLQGDEFKPHSALKTAAGQLFFGGINGFNAFFPEQIVQPAAFSPLVVASFLVFNKPLSPASINPDSKGLVQDIADTKSITLSHLQSITSLEYAALNYGSTLKKIYAFKLEGLDSDWNYVGARNTASYTNLPAGRYRFKLKYQNSAGQWSPVSAVLKITVVPPFWLTWWFELLTSGFVAATITGIFKIRLGAIKQALEKQVQERTDLLARKTIDEHHAREEAEKANEAKSLFLATMSHEIRTPMNGVIGTAALLSGTALTAEQQEYTETIRNCGDALLSVINDILDFSKIESGRMELDEHEFDVRKCIEGVLDVFAGSHSKLNLDLIYQIAGNAPVNISGDELRLRQVLLNLVGNAIKFTQNGEVVITLTSLPTEGPGPDLRFSIADTGIGIPEEKIPRLFNAFSQVDSSATRKYGGSGLGLAISKRLVELMHGEIGVVSRPGEGTTFNFNILSKGGSKSSMPEPVLLQTGLQDQQILIVDDNAKMRLTLRTHLIMGFIPTEAASGQEALEILSIHQDVKIVLTDLNMPEMDGLQLAKIIRSSSPDIRLILLSTLGSALPETELVNFNGVVNKPVKYQGLYNSILSQFDKTGMVEKHQLPKNPFSLDFAKRFPMEILIGDGNQINQKVISRMLSKMGYDPVVMDNGLQVLESMEKTDANLFLWMCRCQKWTDWKPPGE